MPISHLLELSCAVGIPDVTYRVIGFIATMRSLEALEHVGRVSTRAQYTRDIQCEKNSSRRPWRKLVSMQMFLLTDYNLRMCSHFNFRSGLSEVIRLPTRQLFSQCLSSHSCTSRRGLHGISNMDHPISQDDLYGPRIRDHGDFQLPAAPYVLLSIARKDGLKFIYTESGQTQVSPLLYFRRLLAFLV